MKRPVAASLISPGQVVPGPMFFFLALFLGGLLLGPITLSVLALSLLLDSGCLRVGAFLFGWFFLAPLTGLVLASSLVIAAGMQGNLSAEAGVGGALFICGYPIVAFLLHRHFERLPEEQREPRKQAITSGALFGFGGGTGERALKSGAGNRKRMPACADTRL